MQGLAYLGTSVTIITRALQHLRKGVRSTVCTDSSCLPGVILNPDTSQLACPRIWTFSCWSHAFELGRLAITPIHTNIHNCRHVIIYITHKLPLAHSWVVGHCKRDNFFFFFPKGISLMGLKILKRVTANAGDTRDISLIPGLRRFPGGGNGNPLQYSP